MAVGYTTIMKLPLATQGTAAWATYIHKANQILDGGVVTVTKASGATTFADASGVADNGKKPIIRTTQTLTATVVVGVPAKHRVFLVENFSLGTGRFKVCTASTAIGVIVPKNKRQLLRSTTTGVFAASKVDGQVSSATELAADVVTATNAALKANSVVTAKIADAAVTVAKLAGGASYGRILYTVTAAGFAWNTLARGTANQELAMSTAANTLPVWRDSPFRKVATSTGISMPAASDIISFTHGITGLSNKYDYKLITVIAECIATDAGYSVGDCIQLASNYGSTGGGMAIIADSLTVVKLLVSNAGWPLWNKSSGAATVMTLTKWVARFKVCV